MTADGSGLVDRDVRLGTDAVALLPEIVGRSTASRVLLVTGKHSFEASGAASVAPALEAVAKVRRWCEFSVNADATDVLAGLRVVEEFQPDLMLGIGGGSAMDMTKLLCAFRGTSEEEALRRRIRSGERAETRHGGLVLVPTTSGSGSEATRFAVVYVDQDKYSVEGSALLPDTAVLDPQVTLSGSAYQRATSGIDAVAQAIESTWAVGATPASRAFAGQALDLLLPAIEPFVNEPDERSARAMSLGSHLAGRAIDISKTTAAHALAYGITKRHGVSHGHAVALTLGAFIELHAEADDDQLQPGLSPAAHREAVGDVVARLGADGASACSAFASLLASIGLNPELRRAARRGTPDPSALAAAVNADRLANNPVLLSHANLADLLAGHQPALLQESLSRLHHGSR